MNDRIRELAEQVYGTQATEQEIKFAHLLIRECARVAIAKQTENDIDNIVSKNPAKDFAYALVEHFGVDSA